MYFNFIYFRTMSSQEDDLTPKDNKEYKTKEYWDQRYQKYVKI